MDCHFAFGDRPVCCHHGLYARQTKVGEADERDVHDQRGGKLQAFQGARCLSDKELALRNLRRKYVSTYKRQYSQLNDLCVEYWETAGSGKEKERIYAKVKRLVSVIDDCNQKKLERMIDENLDGIMGKLRADLPDATDNEFRFIALNILGFDAKTIARIMGYTVQSVYTKRARMRAKISEIVSENKDFYLDFIG